MSTRVGVNVFTHSVTHVTGEMIGSLKKIISWSGLSIFNLTNKWDSVERAIHTWISSRHLTKVTLEIYSPTSGDLVTRWDFEIDYSYSAGDDGSLWADHEAIRNAIAKAGAVAADCKYEFIMKHDPGAPAVDGWGPRDYRSTAGFNQHSVGTTIGAYGLGSSTSFWRKAS